MLANKAASVWILIILWDSGVIGQVIFHCDPENYMEICQSVSILFPCISTEMAFYPCYTHDLLIQR